MSPRTGRPKIENPKTERITVRLDEVTVQKLDEVAKKYEESRAETVRRGIDREYQEIKK